MALIYDSRFRALDSSGNPLVGATLTIYEAGTTTLASVYRDADLSNAMTNPTSGSDVSDSGGWFPQIFAAEGSIFDITLKTSAGVTVKTYADVEALGSVAGSIQRDFGASRLWIGNRGGNVHIEAGNATGDDIGGDLTLGGWNNTQADTITLDGAAITATGTFDAEGRITEGGKKLPGVVYTEGTFSAVSNVDITIPNDPAGVTAYDLDIIDMLATAGSNPNLTIRVSTDNGASYIAADYADVIGAGTGSSGTLGTTLNVTAPICVRCRLSTPASGLVTMFGTTYNFISLYQFGSRVSVGAGVRVTNVRISTNTGTVAGRYRLVPLRGTGD